MISKKEQHDQLQLVSNPHYLKSRLNPKYAESFLRLTTIQNHDSQQVRLTFINIARIQE